MKHYAHIFGYIFLTALLFSCSKNDDSPNPGEPGSSDPVSVRLDTIFSLAENGDPVEIPVTFDAPARVAGTIKIRITADLDLQVQTVPAPVGGVIELEVEEGDLSASFTLVPVNDALIGGMKSVSFEVISVSNGFTVGEQASGEVEIIDDELAGKPKSFETSGGGWKVSRTYEYRPDGLIDKVRWKNETPNETTGTDTYFYSEGKIARINYYPGRDAYFLWENGRIRSSEILENGIRKSYSEYDYDAAGNIGAIQEFTLQPNGEYVQSYVYIYLYFNDGNLYKQLTYIPTELPEEYELTSTRTHENYLDKPNEFPVNEIVPTVRAQVNLPGSFRIEQGTTDLTYLFSYEFDSEGRVTRRATNGEVTTYTYY